MNDVNGVGRPPYQRFFFPTIGSHTANPLTFDLSAPVPLGRRLVVEFIHHMPTPACADNPVLLLSSDAGAKFYFGRGSANRDPLNHNVLLHAEAGQKLRIRMSNECAYGMGLPILISGRYVDVVS
ncbi:MAG: hypothetical protein R2729_20115 [Bryobacteraceae bacterium]